MPGELVAIIMFAIIPITAIGYPLARAVAKRIARDGEQPRVPAEVAARLERMEQAIDAMAIEMERVSEGQRFVTKVLAGRPAAALVEGSSTERSDGE